MSDTGARTGRTPRLLIVLAAVAVVIVAILLWRAHRAPEMPPEDTTIPVNAETVRLRDVAITLDANGVVTSLAVAPVKPRVDGLLTAIAFREGDQVRAGQVLATIDPRPYRAEVARAEANLRKDRALAADLRLNESRARQLAKLGAAPEQNADTFRAQADAATATADADAAQVALARLNLGFTRITAPIDGRAGLRQVDVGTIVRAADPAPLVAITRMAPISVLFPVSQARLADLHAAQARGAVPVAALVDGRPATQGALAAIDSAVDPASGQVRLRASFANADRALWPGQVVAVRIALRTLAGAVTIGDGAVLNGPSGPYVYVVGPRRIVAARPVVTGPSVGGVTVIARGLRSGEQVVSSGQSRLKPGSRVAVQKLRR